MSAAVRAGYSTLYLQLGLLHAAHLSAAVLQTHLALRHQKCKSGCNSVFRIICLCLYFAVPFRYDSTANWARLVLLPVTRDGQWVRVGLYVCLSI